MSDDCDIYLRRALAYLVAAVLGSPPQSNHIWYHLFAAHELKDSYMTGLLVCIPDHCLMHGCI